MEIIKKELTDRRCKKTKLAIRKALLQLLETKSVNEISIKELTILADINRKTFYNHYSCIEDVIYEIEDIIIEKLRDILSHSETHDIEFPTYIDDTTEEIYKERDNIRLILKGSQQIRLFSRANDLISDWLTGNGVDSPKWLTQLPAYQEILQSSIFIMYQVWVTTEPQTLSPQQISDFIKNYLTTTRAFLMSLSDAKS